MEPELALDRTTQFSFKIINGNRIMVGIFLKNRYVKLKFKGYYYGEKFFYD